MTANMGFTNVIATFVGIFISLHSLKKYIKNINVSGVNVKI